VISVIALFLGSSRAIDVSQDLPKSVVRIELQKHYIPHVEFEDLEENEEEDDRVQIEIDENNFT